MTNNQEFPTSIGVMTSGGDAPGMNPAVRAVVRTALHRGVRVFAVKEGYRGLAEDYIEEADWDYVGGIIDKGGTRIGTTRYPEFEQESGKLKAALNLIKRGIDRLVIIGGDGSLTGASFFCDQWPWLVTKLAKQGKISQQQVEQYPRLAVVGLVGSIDNDMCDTDFTIGADTALHRISEAVDAIGSTAASHQRIFVVKVMGRHCGYLALTGALISGADWVMIPEKPSRCEDWKEDMIRKLKAGVKEKRAIIVILAEGAIDSKGNHIGSQEVKEMLEQGLKKEGEEKADVRVTILGHVQRGGAPSAFDRILSSRQGDMAVEQILSPHAFDNPWAVVDRGNRLQCVALNVIVEKTRKISHSIDHCEFDRAMDMRGDLFKGLYKTANILMKPSSFIDRSVSDPPRFALLHSGAPAAGMNAAVRAAARLAMDAGCEMWGVERGFEGLINGNIKKLEWTGVNGWASMGGAELGVSRNVPKGQEFSRINDTLARHNIQGILMVGGWSGYEGMYRMMEKRELFYRFDIPVVCIPATVSSNLPGTEVSVGSDTALNNIIDAVDKIKQSAVATRRCFVVEVSGRYCGYLALMSGLATGAERVYMHEQNLTLEDLLGDLRRLTKEFRDLGRRVALMIRSERAYRSYDTPFMTALFNEESKGHFDARQAILGHLQHGGNPSPLDRILATRFASHGVDFLVKEIKNKQPEGKERPCVFLGLKDGEIVTTPMKEFYELVEKEFHRATNPWWLDLRPMAKRLAREPDKDLKE